jgi:hypothetical protein
VFGELKIVPAADLGEMGPQQGQATNFNWKWHYSAPGLLIWLALILALIVPKANHNPRILWILVPLVILNLAWLVFKKLSGMPSSSASQFEMLIQSMVIGIAVLWLTANYLEKLGGVARFFIAFGMVLIVAGLGTLSYFSGFSMQSHLFAILFATMTLALLLAMTVSSLLCRRRYRPGRFMLWLGLWILLGSVLAFGVTYALFILAIGPGSSRPDLSQIILSMVMPGVIFAVFLYMLILPFMLLGFAHPFFRRRFCACLGLHLAPDALASQARENAEVASFREEN